MTRFSALAASVIVAGALAVPSAVEAQATNRGGSSSGGSSGGSSRGGSDGGGAVAVPRASSPAPAPAGGSPAPRSSGSRPASVSGSRAPGGSSDSAAAAMRTRSSQVVRGVAQPRGYRIDRNPPQLFNPWGRWSPWYGYGYGSYGYGLGPYYGLIGYSPWLYNSAWSWSLYGWQDPFLFDPYGYGPNYGYTTSTIDLDDRRGEATGALRLRVNPGEARVYIDGALAGVASEFGGLSGHLDLPAGQHELELRADGYTPYVGQVDVREGRTQTERITLEQP